MHAFPFTSAEWQSVQEASHKVLNATLANDTVLQASLLEELLLLLAELRERHGDHPVLWETEADFANDAAVRRSTYLKALTLATQHALPTYSIRISLARLLLEDYNAPQEARRELTACEQELVDSADDCEMQEWSELMDQCNRHLGDCTSGESNGGDG